APVPLRQREYAEQRDDRQSQAGARTRHHLGSYQHDENSEINDKRREPRRLELFLTMLLPDGHDVVRGPGGGQQYERVEQGRKMVPVGEKSNGFINIGGFEKPQWARRALGNLRQPDESARKPHAEHDETHQAALVMVELKRAKEDRERREERKRAE